MTVTSMTGFARTEGLSGPSRWSWEVKTVNGKGLDIKLRLPPGLDGVEAAMRTSAAQTFARGSCFLSLTLKRDSETTTIRINHRVLDAVIDAMVEAGKRIDAAAPRL